MENIRRKISEFVEDICEGKVDAKLLELHAIPAEAVEILKNKKHASNELLRRKTFFHLHDNICVYEKRIENGEEKHVFNDDIEKRLYSPERVAGFVPGLFHLYPEICNIDNTFQQIKGLNAITNISQIIGINGSISSSGFEEDKIAVSMQTNDLVNYYRNIDSILKGKSFIVGQNSYTIAENGAHVASHTNKGTLDEVEIFIDKFYTSTLSPDNKYIFRYVTPLDSGEDLTREIAWGRLMSGNSEVRGMILKLGDQELKVGIIENGGEKYLVIDSQKEQTFEDMNELAFSICVALGLFTAYIPLQKCWVIAYENETFNKSLGLFYSKLIPSVKCSYSIYTQNVYSVLIPVTERLYGPDKKSRVLEIINANKLGTVIDCISPLLLEKIIDNFNDYESLRRGIYLVLSGSNLPLELQPASYAIALESISNIYDKICTGAKKNLVETSIWDADIKPRLRSVLDEFKDNDTISEIEHNNLITKLDRMNNGFNSDKLCSLLVKYNYPLTKFDKDTLSFRNPLLHGSVHIKKMKGKDFDNLFHLSLNFHKLCCSIPLLMAGYEGYIINNPKLYGFDKSKAFIKIGKEN